MPISGSINLIPFFYGGDTYISVDNVLNYANNRKCLISNLSTIISSIVGDNGLVKVTILPSFVASFYKDYYVPTVGDTIIISGITGTGDFNGTYKIKSIDENGTFTYSASGEGKGDFTNATIYVYAPIIYHFPIHSISNIGFRQEGNNDYEKFSPKTNLLETNSVGDITQYKYLTSMKLANYANYYIYTSTWNLLNVFKQDVIITNIYQYITEYTNRIYSTIPRPEGSIASNWRKIKPLDYVDISSNKGEIIKIVGYENILYIRTKFGLKRGVINDTLKTGDGIDITLKSTDIFDNKVQDVFDAPNLFLPSFNKRTTIFTPYGLVTLDFNAGKIYLITNEIKEISTLGVEEWLKTKLNAITLSNVQQTTAIKFGYDDLSKTLYLTATNGSSNVNPNVNFTLSFNLEYGFWIGFHNYTPDIFIPNKNGMFYIKNRTLYKLHSGTFGNFEGTYYDFSVDFLFNSDSGESFLLNSVNWLTNIEASLINYWNETISKIAIFNKNQCTGEISIVKKETSYDESGNLVATGNTQFNKGGWTFNVIEDIVTLTNTNSNILTSEFDINTAILNTNKAWYERAKFIAKGVIVRLIYNNTVANKRIRISDININGKKVL